MNSDKILSFSPWVEVLTRILYWRLRFINRLLSTRSRRGAKSKNSSSQRMKSTISFQNICDQLVELGVNPGDTMLVHSSGAALRPTKLSPEEICEKLIASISPGGTLAMPAIPLYADEPSGIERLSDSICNHRLVYDVQKTPIWTGALPKALLKFPGAIRSRHPLNSMVAVGPLAEQMMKSNIEGSRPLACGPSSSWKFCADQNAHIVCLGVDTAHSLTMIHVAEDSFSEEWPIPDWYRERMFHIVDGDFEMDITVRERRPKWAMYYGERTLQKDLIKAGILKVSYVDGLRIEICRSAELLDFLQSRNSSGYPYWLPFGIGRK